MDAVRVFHDIAADPQAYARDWKAKTGGKVVGTFCSYAPEELILASGALGYRIVGGSGAVSKADAHLQAYCCSLVRGAMEDALDHRLDFLDGTIFPHTCDSIQRLSDLWRMNAQTGFHLDVVLPVKLDTASAKDYMRAVWRKPDPNWKVSWERPFPTRISGRPSTPATASGPPCNGSSPSAGTAPVLWPAATFTPLRARPWSWTATIF